MKAFYFTLPVLLGALLVGLPAFGQIPDADQLVATTVATVQKQYTNSFVGHPQLYNGPEYVDYSKPYHERTGFQFFDSAQKQTGSVHYNGHVFTGVPLAYDEVLDQVVISPPSSPLTLRLINEKVRTFTIGDHRFVRIVADSLTGKELRTGYYEVLLDSTVQVLAKRTKRMQEHIAQPYINVEFTASDKLFIQKAGHYYPVSSKSSVVHVFDDRSKEVQKYVQEHKLKFKKAQREADIVQLAAYYAGLPLH